MRIVHLSIARQFTSGQTKQLEFEAAAARRLEGVEWRTLAYHTGPLTKPFMRPIPRFFQSQFMRKLYGWILALKLSKQYDIVMMRHMTFDPFALVFAPLISNRVTVHHAKEVEELKLIRAGWKGRVASALEIATGKVAVRNAMAILGVTKEIAEYEKELHAKKKVTGIYPNGIDLTQVGVIGDSRNGIAIEAAFICGTFSEWHGLDKLIAAVDEHRQVEGEPPLTIHLIGRLSDQQMRDITATEARRRIFLAHGTMRDTEYRPVLERCDIGIASLAMDRQNLREGSTLKVREMLAMGLPVYSGHEDLALQKEKPFVMTSSVVKISDLIAFGKATKGISRDAIRESSAMLIDKFYLMTATASWMEKVSSEMRPSVEVK